MVPGMDHSSLQQRGEKTGRVSLAQRVGPEGREPSHSHLRRGLPCGGAKAEPGAQGGDGPSKDPQRHPQEEEPAREPCQAREF